MSAARNLWVQETYGADPPIAADADPACVAAYAKALLTVAGADGMSSAEMQHFVAWQRASEHPESLIEELSHFDYRNADIKQVIETFCELSKETPGARRALIYDAIRLSWADGKYSPTERKALQQLARELGVEEAVVIALEGAVSIEFAARQMRLALFKAT